MTKEHPVVLLTGGDIQHRFVAGVLANGPGLDAIILVQGEQRPLIERVRRAKRRFGARGCMQRTLLGLFMRVTGEARRRRCDLDDILGPATFPSGVPIHTVASANGSDVLSLLDQVQPDVLCIYGTPIIGDATLSRARRVALNLHTGISPMYRGADCSFWPLSRDEPHYVGSTVHICTSALDGGPIYATSRARLEANDGVGAVFARAVTGGAGLYAQVVESILAGSNNATPQDLAAGSEFIAAMRGWRAELAVWRKLRHGLVRDYVAAGQPEDWSTRMVE